MREIVKILILLLAVQGLGCESSQSYGALSDEELRRVRFEANNSLPPLEGEFQFESAIPCEVEPWSSVHNDDSREYVQYSRIPVESIVRSGDFVESLVSGGISHILAANHGGHPSTRSFLRGWVSTWGAEASISCAGQLSTGDLVLVEEISRDEDTNGDFDLASELFDQQLFEPLSDESLSFEKGDPDA